MINAILALASIPVLLLVLAYPSLAIAYLLGDSWLILGGGADDELGLLSKINYVVASVYFLSVFAGVALKRMEFGKGFFRSPVIQLTIAFLMYLLVSSVVAFGAVEHKLIGHAAFFIAMVLFFASGDLASRMRVIQVMAIVMAACLVLAQYMKAGSLVADVMDGSRIQPGFHVLLTIPLAYIALGAMKRRLLAIGLFALLIAFLAFVATRHSRSLTASLILLVAYYVLSRRTPHVWRWAIVLAIVALGPIVFSSQFVERLHGSQLMQGAAYLDDDSINSITSGRASFYTYAWNAFLDHRLFGAGYDFFRRTYSSNEEHALHSAWLQVLTETGVAGFLLYFGIFVAAWANHRAVIRVSPRDGFRAKCSEAATVGIFCFAMGGIFDNFGFDYRLFYLFVALAVGARHAPHRTGRSWQTQSEPAAAGSAGYAHDLVGAEREVSGG
jgi:O-antigen ligase